MVQAHAAPPDAAQAEAHYQQALALAEELGMRPLLAHCHLGWAGCTATGREEARAALTAAIDLYRAMDMTFWLLPGRGGTGANRRRIIPRKGGLS